MRRLVRKMVNPTPEPYQACHASFTDGVRQKCALDIQSDGCLPRCLGDILVVNPVGSHAQLRQAALQDTHHGQTGEFAHGAWLAPRKRSLLQTQASRETVTTPTPFK